MLRLIHQGLIANDSEFYAIEALRELSTRFHNARKGRLSVLEQCHREAAAMLASTNQPFEACLDLREEPASPGLTKSIPAIYTSDSSEQKCTGIQGGTEPMESTRTTKPSAQKGGPGVEDFGLKAANYHPSEAADLFPATEGLIETGGHGTVQNLAAISGVNNALAKRVELSIGALPTSVCLLIIAQKLAKGELLTTPDQYLGGMWKRARSGDLNLGKSIKGLRKKLTTNHPSAHCENAHATH